jgi:hypothetical protein
MTAKKSEPCVGVSKLSHIPEWSYDCSGSSLLAPKDFVMSEEGIQNKRVLCTLSGRESRSALGRYRSSIGSNGDHIHDGNSFALSAWKSGICGRRSSDSIWPASKKTLHLSE